MMITIYYYCFHSGKLNVLEQIPPAVFGLLELLDRSKKKLEAGCCCPFKISPEVRRKENLGKENTVAFSALTFPYQFNHYVRSNKRHAWSHLHHNEGTYSLRAKESVLEDSTGSLIDFFNQSLSYENQTIY